MSNIILENVDKLYGKEIGIKDLSLTIEQGEIMGLIGPNGAGKSTTIRTILNLIKKDAGSITVFDKDSVKDNVAILNEVGYLPGELNYYDNMRVIELLKYSESFYKKDCSARRDELASILNLNMDLKIHSLSLGNKKKLGIIDALQHEPKFLILDEPTSGLDPLMQQKFFDILLEEKEKGTTILFSSHVIAEVQKICDRVAIVKDGSIINLEDIEELLQNQVKSIELTTTQKIDKKINGMTNIVVNDTKASFMYRGDLNRLIRFLANFEVVNLEITEPTLEQVFMHYYE